EPPAASRAHRDGGRRGHHRCASGRGAPPPWGGQRMTDAMATAEYDMMARVEDGYWWYRDLRRRVTTSLHAALGAAPQRILDVGCGTGANARALRAAFPSSVIVGTDIAP